MSGLLSGLEIVKSPAALAAEVAMSEGGVLAAANTLSAMERIDYELQEANTALHALLDSTIAVEAINPQTPEERKLARFLISSNLTTLGAKAEDALTVTAGIESEGTENVGVEAWEDIKGVVSKAIDWVITKFKEFRTFVMKHFNKFFGDVERLKKSWETIKKEADTKSQYTISEKEKMEFEGAKADALSTGTTIVNASEAISAIGEYKTIVAACNSKLIELKVKELDADGIKKLLKENDSVANIRKALDAYIAPASVGIKASTSAFGQENVVAASPALLGRSGIVFTADKTASSADVALKKVDLKFVDLAKEQKPLKAVKAEVLTMAEIEKISDANIDMLDALIDFKRSKTMEKLEDDLAKQTKELESWKKDVPSKSDDATTEEIAQFKQGVKVATAYFESQRRIKLQFPVALSKAARDSSVALRGYAVKSIGRHKKAD